ncbi:hypothetical protein [Acrocarpospora sp. B8E8]|uniref:hypothetical protein n=1 Tax=Acrocarpospora sp. B8E8 TaxID=3153572 RepID=UPI00325DDDD2
MKINDLRECGTDTIEHTEDQKCRRNLIRPGEVDHEAKKLQLTVCELGLPPTVREPYPIMELSVGDRLMWMATMPCRTCFPLRACRRISPAEIPGSATLLSPWSGR